ARHAGRNGATGSDPPPDHLRPGVHGTSGPPRPRAPLFVDVPNAFGAPDGSSSRESRIRHYGAARRLPGRSMGSEGRRLGDSGASSLDSLRPSIRLGTILSEPRGGTTLGASRRAS